MVVFGFCCQTNAKTSNTPAAILLPIDTIIEEERARRRVDKRKARDEDRVPENYDSYKEEGKRARRTRMREVAEQLTLVAPRMFKSSKMTTVLWQVGKCWLG